MALTRTTDDYVINLDRDSESAQRRLSIQNEGRNLESSSTDADKKDVADDTKARRLIRLCVFVVALGCLIAGRLSVPDNSPICVVDKVMDFFQGVNDFIWANPGWRDALQIICSLFMDSMFLSLGGYWIWKGSSCRLVVTIAIFYLTRSLIQTVYFSPFTKGYWWYDPGFPSIVVPYGRGSDFFYSGHVGFVTICVCEWASYGNKLMVTLLTLGGIYTGFILISYQVHYCIDLFAGVIYAHWTFMMVDRWKDTLDGLLDKIYFKSAVALGKTKVKKNKVTDDMKLSEKLVSNEKY